MSPFILRREGRRESGAEREEKGLRERETVRHRETDMDRQTDTQTETESISVKLNYYVIIKPRGIIRHNQMSLLTAQNVVLI